MAKVTDEDNEATAARLEEKRDKIRQLQAEEHVMHEQASREVTAEQLTAEEELLDAQIKELQDRTGVRGRRSRSAAPSLPATDSEAKDS